MVETTLNCSEILISKNSVLRHEKLKKFIDNNNFDNFLLRLIFEHDIRHDEYCRFRGRKTMITNKMMLLFEYVFKNNPIDEQLNLFEIYYKGYYFCIKKYNKGSLYYIQNDDDSKIIFSKFIYD